MKKARSTSAAREPHAAHRSAERERGPHVAFDAHVERLLANLEQHRMELEAQNQELRATYASLDVERARHAAEHQRYRDLFDSAPTAYFVVDPVGTISELNSTGAVLLAAPRERLIGRRFALFVAPAQRMEFADFLEAIAGAPTRPNAPGCEVTLMLESADPRDVRVTGARLETPANALLLSIEDLTLPRRVEALREEGRLKDEFLAVLSHELRNPLTPIRNSVVILERAEPGGERARNALEVIKRQVDHLTHLVDDLLDVTRIVRGKVQLRRHPIDLGELTRRTVDDHRPMFEACGVVLELDCARGCWVDADATRIVQVIGNLLGNAAKFTPQGGKVEVRLRHEGSDVALSVRDTGPGIAPEMKGRLFKPFHQAPQTLARTSGGLGLGLAMVKGLVELHGGRVEVESQDVEPGAEFTVRIPMRPAAPTQPVATHRPAEGGRYSILLIEDNEDAADSMRDMLELLGHEVHVAYDGARGLAMAKASGPQIVLCDIGLPKMDGYAVAQALRKDPSLAHTFLIALTGYALPEDIGDALKAGFDRHLAKPPSVDRLEELLASASGRLRSPNKSPLGPPTP